LFTVELAPFDHPLAGDSTIDAPVNQQQAEYGLSMDKNLSLSLGSHEYAVHV
jgi:hypothetical protein